MQNGQDTQGPKVIRIGQTAKGDKLAPGTVKRMDELTALYAQIHTFTDHLKKEIGELKEPEIRNRAIYEFSLAQTHLEDALIRHVRGMQYLDERVK